VEEKSRRLGKAEGLLQAILDHSPSPIWVKDEQGRFIRVNRALYEGWGFEPDFLIGKTEQELFPHRPELAELVRKTDQEVLDLKQPVQREERFEKNNAEKTYLSVKFPIPLGDGGTFALGGIAVDVTERKRAEEAAKQGEEEFRNLANSIPQLAWMTDAQGWIFWYNNRCYEYTGASLEDMRGWGWERLIHPDHVEHVLSFVNQGWKSGEPFELTLQLRKHTGEFRWFLTRAIPIREVKGRLVRWFGTNTDIHDQKLTEQTLQVQTQLLEQSNSELAQFAFVASHDLKEPLRVVANYSQMLLKLYKDKSDPDASVFTEHITSAVKRMYALLNDLLSFSRVGAQSLALGPVDCQRILDSALANLETTIQETHATVVVNNPLPEILGDETQLVQLFQNLLSNALKYRHPDKAPRIEISVEKSPTQWNFRFKDNGIGIEAQYFEKIFELFQRLHGRDQYSGTGIGLSVCKRIVERHEGTIGVESTIDVGSTFFFSLPKERKTASQTPLRIRPF
jgi:PAS domain S-box-containing protein